MDRRTFIKYILTGSVLGPSIISSCFNKTPTDSKDCNCPPKTGDRTYVVQEYWMPESTKYAKEQESKFDKAVLAGARIAQDGSFVIDDNAPEHYIPDKSIYRIQNTDENGKFIPEMIDVMYSASDSRLKNELERFPEGIVFWLGFVDWEKGKEYEDLQKKLPKFLERVRKNYGNKIILLTEALGHDGTELIGNSRHIDYEAVSSIADAVIYNTRDKNPGDPNEPIASLADYDHWFDTLFSRSPNGNKIEKSKIMPVAPTYVKCSIGEEVFNDKPLGEIQNILNGIEILDPVEGRFRAEFEGREVKGWMPTKTSLETRKLFFENEGMDKILYYRGGKILEEL